MPDFDVFSLLDIPTRYRSSRNRKYGNLKRKHKNKTVWTLTDLWKILKSGCHQMLSKFSSLSIVSLRKLDEANKFYDRKHDFYHTSLLTRCYTQHAFRPYIDSEIIHINRHFIKMPFINKGIDFIDLPSIFRDNTADSSIPDSFENKEPPLFVKNIINLLEVQQSISINWLLILILIQRLQIH